MTRDSFGDQALIRDVRQCLREDDPLGLLTLCSALLSLTEAGTRGWEGGAAGGPPRGALLESFIGVDVPETTALLLGLQALLPDGPERRLVTAALRSRRGPRPAWLANLNLASVGGRGQSLTQYAGDFHYYLFSVEVPGSAPLACSVAVDLITGGTIFDVLLVPGRLSEVRALAVSQPEEFQASDELDSADIRARLDQALSVTESSWPPITTESWPASRALLEWLVGLMPLGGDVEEVESSGRHLAEFSASPEAAGLSEEELGQVGQIFEFAQSHQSGDPMRWSPARVDDMLYLISYSVLDSDEAMRRIPALLGKVIAWAGRVHGTPPTLVADTLAAVEERTPEYVELLREDRASDSHDLRAWEWSHGPDDRDELDDVPLPWTGPDWSYVPLDVEERASQWWSMIEDYVEGTGLRETDPEQLSAYANLFNAYLRVDPRALKRGKRDNGVAALLLVSNRINNVRGGVAPHEFFGLKAPVYQRAATIEHALGIERYAGPYTGWGSPDFLTSRRRAEILRGPAF